MSINSHAKRQVSILALTEGIVDAIVGACKDSGAELPASLDKSIGRLRVAGKRISRRLFQGVDELALPPKVARCMARTARDLVAEIHRAWPGETVSASEYLNAVLAIVEDERAQLPRVPLERRLEWNDMVDALVEVYSEFDPDLLEIEDQEFGAQVGGRFRRAFGG
jgi:hypothetical protein